MKRIRLPVYIMTALIVLVGQLLAWQPVEAASALNGRLLYSKSGAGLESVRADGTGSKTVLDEPATDAAYSPDGTEIIYHSGNGGALYKMDANGNNGVALTDTQNVYGSPSWSSDGSKIVFMSNNRQGPNSYQLFTMNTDGSNMQQITNISADLSNARYSPDGSQILATGYTFGVGLELYKMNANGSNIVQLTNTGGDASGGAWSPDGNHIVYRSGDYIHKMTANGSNSIALTSGSDGDYYPIYSPDGSKIAFARSVGGVESEIIVMNADGSNASAVASGQFTMENLSWQPLTIAPATAEAHKIVTLNTEGTATIDIPALYTDVYDGIDTASVTITNSSAKGSLSVSGSGVVTYQKSNAISFEGINLFSRIMDYFIPTASAQSADDSFSYQICSMSNPNLCSTDTVFLAFASVAAASGSGTGVLASTGINRIAMIYAALILVLGGISLKIILTKIPKLK